MNLQFTSRSIGIVALVFAAFVAGSLSNAFLGEPNTMSAASRIDSSSTIPRELLADGATIVLSHEGGATEVQILEVQGNWVKFKGKNSEGGVWTNADALSARWSVKTDKTK